MNNNLKNSKSGMTLIEVMIASLLFIMGLTTFLSAFTVIQRVSKATDNRMAAMYKARTIIEILQSEPYDSPYLYIGTHSLSYATYTISISTKYQATKDITVTVPWISPQGNANAKMTLKGSTTECRH
jgi:Tfp pilus assembly protein PilV